MWPFNKKEEVSKVLVDMDVLKRKLEQLEASLSKLETDQLNLRGQFNRKLKGIAEFEAKHGQAEEPKKAEEAKDLNKTEPKVFTGMHVNF